MPSRAVTGTKQTKTAKSKPEPKVEVDEVREPVADKPVSNGTIQVTTRDGAIVNVNTAEEGWKAKVKDLDPKHPVFKYDR